MSSNASERRTEPMGEQEFRRAVRSADRKALNGLPDSQSVAEECRLSRGQVRCRMRQLAAQYDGVETFHSKPPGNPRVYVTIALEGMDR